MKTLGKEYLSIIVVLFLIISEACYALNLARESYIEGVEYASQGKFIKAKEEFEKTLLIDPLFLPAKYRLNIIKDIIEQKIAAKAAMYLFTGISYDNKGQANQAIEEYTKALEIDPVFAVAYFDRGDAYHRNGQLDLAIKDYTKFIEIHPEDAFSYINRGNVYRDKGQNKLAIQDYTTAIDINSELASPYVNRGNAYAKNDQFDLAIRDYTKAIEINPKYAIAYYSRGKTYSDNGQYDLATRDYTKTIEIYPKHASSYLNRGFINFVKLGNKVKGCSDWKNACDLGKCSNFKKARQQGYCLQKHSINNKSPLVGISGNWDLKGFVVGGDTPMSLFNCGKVMTTFPTAQTGSISTACDKIGDYYFRLSKHKSEKQTYLITVHSKVGISVNNFPIKYTDGQGWRGESDQFINGKTVSIVAMVQPIEGRNWYGWTIQVLPSATLKLSLDDIKEPFFKADLTRRK
ncbi:MAG: hypothetical protein DRQ62_00730 [Gammaproteobacteria bacterium]|nr:MAG: hypothetical protein DRQ62_00730 [Gammaproteobacteria bacterium]